jgi:REP element-mobilizing transposase RayT
MVVLRVSIHPDISLPLTPGYGYHIYNRGNEKRDLFFVPRNYHYFLGKYEEYMDGFVDTYAYCILKNHFHLLVKVKPVEDILARASQVNFNILNKLFVRRYVLPWFFRPDISGLGLTVLPIWESANVGTVFSDTSTLTIAKLTELLNLRYDIGKSYTNAGFHCKNLEELNPFHQLGSYIVSERIRRFLLGYAKAINVQQNRTGSLFQKAFRRKWIPTEENGQKVVNYIHHSPIHHGICRDYSTYEYSSYSKIISGDSTVVNTEKTVDLFGNLSEFKRLSELYRSYRWDKEKFYIEEN